MKGITSCDLFCSVVDNYGDIGVVSRLARQLNDEQGLLVRVWVDNLQAFRSLHGDISVGAEKQDWGGIQVRRWVQPIPEVIPHDLVIEAFACELPKAFLLAMARRAVKPVWINLEYLSAEAWVAGCHGLPSPHPHLPLLKHFFFPGYSQDTGGLLREQGLAEAIHAYQHGASARTNFWLSLTVPAPQKGELRVSMFAYENPAIPSLLECFARHDAPVTCLLPKGKALEPALDYLGVKAAEAGDVFRSDSLTLRILPFLAQNQYDRLLWACDMNIVRGEDSFVRAQFAGRPLLWQAYEQEGDVHEKKVRAWLDIYLSGVDPATAEDVSSLFLAWNKGETVPSDALRIMAGCRSHARVWTRHLAGLPSLSEELVKFATNKL
jgi:uncharacterized repeat protein (TIGR03837 family)